jgi:GNAT superfamily N-acetyltransferase
MKGIIVREASEEDMWFAKMITDEMESSAIIRGSGISKRSPESIIKKMKEGKAVIAVKKDNIWVGFSYIDVWGNGEFVSNSGLIVAPAYRDKGIARLIKKKIFELSKSLYPEAKIFSITTGLAIIRMNARLGFETVTFNEIAKDKEFWQGCKSCVNFPILENKQCKNCLCTAMLYTPAMQKKRKQPCKQILA